MISRVLSRSSQVSLTPMSLRRWDATHEYSPNVRPHKLGWYGLSLHPNGSACRAVAARLAGFAIQRRNPAAPLPATVTYTMDAPTTRTASSATWELGQGVTLHLELPRTSELAFKIRLQADNGWFTLHPRVAERWASALLTIAALLDDAHAYVATVLNQRWAGHTVEDRLELFLDAAEPELDPAQRAFADQIRRVVADEQDAAQTDLINAAFDVANPDLPFPLSDLLHSGSLDHRDAAEVILRLASKYRIPIFMATADHTEVHNALARAGAGETPLTEQQWRRLANTSALREMPDDIEYEICYGTVVLANLERALLQAGVLCRGPVDTPSSCHHRLDDDVAVTWGRCDEHRPTTLASAIAAPCPTGSLYDPEHVPDGAGKCGVCSLPLTLDHSTGVGDTHVSVRDTATSTA